MSPTPDYTPDEIFKTAEGDDAPFYILQFKKNGDLLPKSKEKLHEIINRSKQFSDIFLFSHGWNNDWEWANKRYRAFFKAFTDLRTKHNLEMSADYNPLLIGVFWPSTALVFGERERGPMKTNIAKADASDSEAEETEYQKCLDEIASLLDATDQQTLRKLVQDERLGEDAALELASLASKISFDNEAEDDTTQYADANQIHQGWLHDHKTNVLPDIKARHLMGKQDKDTASILSKLDPRRVIRLLTVALMKDRAGVVGYHGVGPVLQALLNQSQARLHLIGHSYGAKVVLSALSATKPSSRKVHSALLLQPAISYLAFANSLPDNTGKKEGYNNLLTRVEAPIFATFSSHDFALHKVFHWALRRNTDYGEIDTQSKNIPPDIPSRYAALGGYGPRMSNENLITLESPGTSYTLGTGVRVFGLNGSSNKKIDDHGAVISEHTAWALYSLTQYKAPL
ncbi:hypothetical protein RC77_05435 [Pectobacterium brasiliense]|uniref:hypothetical protein n=1 Tax=Pectobacterium brasiliense TaxID=180957 RepID=UPI0005802A48|nr:hypothetical protein [Pectobacterium brasiliense]KHS70957.1 hypothetical protein RC77_05435 [Pectobacterium brasiliense]